MAKIAFDTVELWAVRYIKDLCDVQLLKQEFCIFGLMDTQVVKEESEILTAKFLRYLINECEENFCVDGFRMYNVIDESTFFTDGSNHG